MDPYKVQATKYKYLRIVLSLVYHPKYQLVSNNPHSKFQCPKYKCLKFMVFNVSDIWGYMLDSGLFLDICI